MFHHAGQLTGQKSRRKCRPRLWRLEAQSHRRSTEARLRLPPQRHHQRKFSSERCCPGIRRSWHHGPMHLLPATPNPPVLVTQPITPAAGFKGRQIGMEDVLRTPDRRARTTAAVAIRRLWTASVFFRLRPAPQSGVQIEYDLHAPFGSACSRRATGLVAIKRPYIRTPKGSCMIPTMSEASRGSATSVPNPLQQQGA